MAKFRRLFWPAFVAYSWAFWTSRNKFTIEHMFPNCPADCLLKMVGLLQQWMPLAKDTDSIPLFEIICKIRASVVALGP